jgi:hypothetical protein
MDSRRVQPAVRQKNEPDPERGRTKTGGTTAALSAFHESPSSPTDNWHFRAF